MCSPHPAGGLQSHPAVLSFLTYLTTGLPKKEMLEFVLIQVGFVVSWVCKNQTFSINHKQNGIRNRKLETQHIPCPFWPPNFFLFLLGLDTWRCSSHSATMRAKTEDGKAKQEPDPGVVGCAFSLSTWETEAGGYLCVPGQPGLQEEFQANQNCIMRPCLNKQANKQMKQTSSWGASVPCDWAFC